MTPILEKIAKLLALSKSSNVNEAAAAAKAAQKLMSEHRISQAEAEAAATGPQERAGLELLDTFRESRVPMWKTALSCELAKLYGCRSWLDFRRYNESVLRVTLIVGRPSDVASVRYLYAWLTSEIERLAQRNAMGRGRRYANSYRYGAVTGVLEAMREANREVRAQATGDALMRIDARAIESDAVLNGLGLNLRSRSSGARFSKDAYERGKAAGRGLHSGAKLGASSGARLLSA